VPLPDGTDIVLTFAGELGRRALPRSPARWWEALVGLKVRPWLSIRVARTQ